MELKHLVTFQTVAYEGSFTRAAEALNYAQSSVTAQIQALEHELGTPLFDRIGKRIAVTEAGHRLLHYAEKFLQLAEEVRVIVPGDTMPSGTLTIGAPESLCTYRLPSLLRTYRARYPEVQLKFRAGICSSLRRELQEGKLDVVFTMEPPIVEANLVVEHLIDERMTVLCEPNHPFIHKSIVTPSDFSGETILVTEEGCSYRTLFEQMLAAAVVKPSAELEFFSIEAIKQCVRAGLGITILPEMCVVNELQNGTLSALPWHGPQFPIVTQLVYHRDKWVSPALRAFIELAEQQLKQQD